jgi:uncharacterized protein YnzC (UPF0291/DUF896 family)
MVWRKENLDLNTSPIKLIIGRVNELARKQRSIGLEAWERDEQEALRQEYLTFIRGQLKDTLSKIEIIEDTPIQ